MKNKEQGLFISADTISIELGISKSHAYKIIRNWNEELKAKGFLVLSGRVSREYYKQKLYVASNRKSDKIASL